MLSEQRQKRIAQACITIVKPNGARGRGVLVPGQLVLTAAHCVTYSTEDAAPQPPAKRPRARKAAPVG
jgi:V8-like Glu-specific endopeptidase